MLLAGAIGKQGEKMHSYRILEEHPLIWEVIDALKKVNICKSYYFEVHPRFNIDTQPSNKELNEIELREIGYKKYGVFWSWQLMEKYGKSLVNQANLIHCYESAEYSSDILFKDRKWSWAYCCHDDVYVELFTPVKEIASEITKKFQIQEIDFPGSIYMPGCIDSKYINGKL